MSDTDRHAGVVRVWHAEEGWGVIDSPDCPGGCWAGFSEIVAEGYRSLNVGDHVTFAFSDQVTDDYDFVASSVIAENASGE